MWRSVPEVLQLPVREVKGGITYVLDALRVDHLPAVLDILHSASQSELGFDPKTITDVHQLKDFLNDRYNFCAWTSEETNKPQGFFTIFDSVVSRSVRPRSMSLLGILHPGEKSKNISKAGIGLGIMLGVQLGYTCLSVRTSVSNSRSLAFSLRSQLDFTAIIPRSVQHGKSEWVPDLVIHKSFTPGDDGQLSTTINTTAQHVPPRPLVNGTDHLNICVARGDCLREAHRLLREAGDRGDGFGVDEFLENGEFAGKLLSNKIYYMARDSNENTLGVGVLGTSTLTRDPASQTAGCYFYVKPQFRGQKIGRWLLQQLEKCAIESNHVAITTDVYKSSQHGLSLLLDCGYQACGTLPDCGQIAGVGWTDSLLMHRMLQPLTLQQLHTKFASHL